MTSMVGKCCACVSLFKSSFTRVRVVSSICGQKHSSTNAVPNQTRISATHQPAQHVFERVGVYETKVDAARRR